MLGGPSSGLQSREPGVRFLTPVPIYPSRWSTEQGLLNRRTRVRFLPGVPKIMPFEHDGNAVVL